MYDIVHITGYSFKVSPSWIAFM